MTYTKTLLTLATLCILGTANAQAAPKRDPNRANCELRLVSNAGTGAGEVFMSIFTHSEEECLGKSDPTVEAKFRNARGAVTAQRGGAGPQE